VQYQLSTAFQFGLNERLSEVCDRHNRQTNKSIAKWCVSVI